MTADELRYQLQKVLEHLPEEQRGPLVRFVDELEGAYGADRKIRLDWLESLNAYVTDEDESNDELDSVDVLFRARCRRERINPKVYDGFSFGA
jgi:hypothetical protein